MPEVVHYREYPLGRAGRVLDAVWAVLWPAVLGTAVGAVVLVLGLAVMEQDATLTADLEASARRAFGVALLALLVTWLAACLVSAARSLLYARRLARYRSDPACQRTPPTPAQRAIARAGYGTSDMKPFSTIRILGFLLAGIGAFLVVFALTSLDSDGAVEALVGSAVAVALGVGLVRLVTVLRRRLAATPVSWRHSPTDPGNAEQPVRAVPLPARYRLAVWADRVARALALGAAVLLSVTASAALGPAAGTPALVPWVVENGPEPGAGLLAALFASAVATVVLLVVALVLEAVRHGVLLGVLDRVAAASEPTADGVPATRPDPRLTAEVLGSRGPVRRAAQLLAGSAALLLVVAGPTIAAVEVRTGAAWDGGPVLVTGAVVAILVALVSELVTAGRDRERRNRLLRTWPRAL